MRQDLSILRLRQRLLITTNAQGGQAFKTQQSTGLFRLSVQVLLSTETKIKNPPNGEYLILVAVAGLGHDIGDPPNGGFSRVPTRSRQTVNKLPIWTSGFRSATGASHLRPQ